jgi:hypothetical protein
VIIKMTLYTLYAWTWLDPVREMHIHYQPVSTSRESNSTEGSVITVLPFYPFLFTHPLLPTPTTTPTPPPASVNADHQSYTVGSSSSSTPLSSTSTPAPWSTSSAKVLLITPACNSESCTCGTGIAICSCCSTERGDGLVTPLKG